MDTDHDQLILVIVVILLLSVTAFYAEYRTHKDEVAELEMRIEKLQDDQWDLVEVLGKYIDIKACTLNKPTIRSYDNVADIVIEHCEKQKEIKKLLAMISDHN